MIKEKSRQVDGLQETLSIPRNHFKNIEKLTVQEILVQKDLVLDKMSREMSVPKEVLVSRMYAKEAKKEALKQVKEGLAESTDEEGNKPKTVEIPGSANKL